MEDRKADSRPAAGFFVRKELQMKKQKRKQVIIMLLSFFIPMAYMVVLYAQKEIYPGGSHTLLTYDMQQQYLEFYASLRNIGSGDNSIFFNWNRSLGGNYLGLYAYYLASPFTWITLLCPLSGLPEAIYVMTILKFGFCGLTFSIFLNHITYQKHRRLSYAAVLFSCCYALMSYNVIYSISIMWLDGVILLPLILIGAEQLLNGKKGALFLITLTLCFLSNYYISYMVGIAVFIYLLYRIGCTVTKENRSEKFRVFLRFAGNTLIAAGLSMPLILPAFLDLKKGKLTGSTGAYQGQLFTADIMDIFSKFFSAHYDSITYSGLPSVFCGTFTLLLVIAFFLQKKHALRQKMIAFIILAFYILSFWIMPLNLAWHGFQAPACYPYRFAFSFCAFMLTLAYDTYCNINWKDRIYRYFRFAGVVLTVAELALNASVILSGVNIELAYCTADRYSLYLNKIGNALAQVEEEDDSFYRLEKDFSYSINDPMLFGYNGLDCFLSTYNQQASVFCAQVGMLQKGYETYGAGSTVFTDALLGVKYRLACQEAPELYQKIGQCKNVGIYRNPYALSIGFMTDAASVDMSSGWLEGPFDNQNKMASEITGQPVDLYRLVNAALSQEERQEGGETVTAYTIKLVAENDDPLYLYPVMTAEYYEKMNDVLLRPEWVDDKIEKQSQSGEDSEDGLEGTYLVTVNGKRVFTQSTYNIAQIIFIGQFEAGEEVTVEITAKEQLDSFAMARLDMDVMQQVYDTLGTQQMAVTEHRNGTIRGTVTAEKGQVLFTTIPYDSGFRILVDGKAVEYGAYADTFITVSIPEGEHEISISYVSPGFLAGCMICMIAGVCGAAYYRKRMR